MTKVKFPSRRLDGTFDVIIRLEGLRDREPRIESWLSDWAARNETWSRTWASAGSTTTETLPLAEEFFAPPELEYLIDGHARVRLKVRADSKWWKDWLAKFTDELLRAHPGAKLLGFESA